MGARSAAGGVSQWAPAIHRDILVHDKSKRKNEHGQPSEPGLLGGGATPFERMGFDFVHALDQEQAGSPRRQLRLVLVDRQIRVGLDRSYRQWMEGPADYGRS
jgi:hypothetical protein